ncbi:MAG: hypothetical protein AAGF93_06245 [Cyanobacteria bacterium P01_H01_bin.105]
MSIEWSLVRRAMLTPGNLFPDNSAENCMSTFVSIDQMDTAFRCIKTFYQGLKWADEFSIKGGYVGNRTFHRTFLLEDAHVLGVFDNRNASNISTTSACVNPSSTKELVHFYQQGKGNIKTLIVLEKGQRRLANSEATGRQSKFLIDVVYPAIEGIRAKLSGDHQGHHWQQILSKAQSVTYSKDSSAGSILHTNLLSDIYHNPKKADEQLAENSPLRLFYTWNSPLNLEFRTKTNTSINLIPCETDRHIRLPNLL